MSSPDGTIVFGGVTINKADFVLDGGSGKYYLDLQFSDSNYKRTMNAVGFDNTSIVSPPFNVKAQAPFQIPPYVIKILKKTTPSSQSTPYVIWESLFENISSFNNQVYNRSDVFDVPITLDNFGLGIVPYYYTYASVPATYSDISQSDATVSGTVSIKLDANGGAAYTAGPSSGAPPNKQVCFGNTASLFSQRLCNSFDINNGFTEPGAYLVIIMRSAIQNSYQSFIDYTVDINNSQPSFTGALSIINPPSPSLSYDVSTNKLKFTITSYGSLTQYGTQKWTITNDVYGVANFSTPKYPYNPNSSNPNGSLPYQYLTFNPSDRSDSLSSLEVMIDRQLLRQIEKSGTDFDVSGAFLYNFRISENAGFTFNPYQIAGSGINYVTYTQLQSDDWTNYFQPSFFGNWQSKIANNQLAESNIFSYSSNQKRFLFSNKLTIVGANSPIPFNTEILKIGSEYLFHSFWTETFQSELTSFLVDSSYVLQLFQKNPTSDISVNETYSNFPVNNYRYVSPSNTGLTVLPNWKTTSPYTMDVYTDKVGNVFYNSAPSAGTFDGWSAVEISGAWIMNLQRNFTPDASSSLVIANEACYAINVSDPSLSIILDSNDEPISFDTFRTITYADASNIWSVYEFDTGNTVSLPEIVSNADPTIKEFEDAYPLRQGPGILTNKVVNKFDVGPHFDISLGIYGTQVVTDLSGLNQTIYEVSTNSVSIYLPSQSNDTNQYFSLLNCAYQVYDTSNIYYQLIVSEPSFGDLRQEAYDINLFRKTKGTGTFESQWSPSGEVVPYVYTDISNRGITISKSQIQSAPSVFPYNPNSRAIYADACGNTSLTFPSDLSGSFPAGGYIAVIRRNFYKSPLGYPNAKEPFYTINSQYIHVSPSQSYFGTQVLNSPDLSLQINPSLTKINSSTPIYGSWDASGLTPNIDIDWYVDFLGKTDPVYFPVANSDGVVTIDTSGGFMDLSSVEFSYAGLGTMKTYITYEYDWSSPSDLSLGIGIIGNNFRTIDPAINVFQRTAPNGSVLTSNQAVAGVFTYLLPDDISWNAQNIVNNLQASFYQKPNTPYRVMAISWRDPSPLDLCANWTGFPYALRLYKKQALAQTPNSQWYNIDNSGVAPYKFIPPNSQGVGISAEFFSQSPTGDSMYFFADASGAIYYNQFPDDPSVITSFNEPGGYILVVQRHYTNSSGRFALSTLGHYLSFIPVGPLNPIPTSFISPLLYSNPNPLSSFVPYGNKGTITEPEIELEYKWNLEIPIVGYNKVIPNQDISSIDIDLVTRIYNGRGTGFITSEVTYDFSIYTETAGSQIPFIEHYPVLNIFGNPFPIYNSLPYEIDLCVKPSSYPPPPWARFTNNCNNNGFTYEELQMRRKAETLRHQTSMKLRNPTKAELYAYVAKGLNQKKKTYATQTINYTNPNTQNYPTSGNGLTLPDSCDQQILTFPSSESNVPGPIIPLTFNPNVPLLRYKRTYTYPTQEQPPGPNSDVN